MPSLACVPEIADLVRRSPPRCGSTRLVCVDGPAGSGKTTLADGLAAALTDAPVVHMDDLYEGWDQALGAPLAARVEAWLLREWESGRAGVHPRYDWELGRFADQVEVPAVPIVILEGCASASGGIRARASLVVWVEAPPAVRLARGLQRDGSALEARWRRWQDHEAAHFAADGTRAAADVIVDAEGRIVR